MHIVRHSNILYQVEIFFFLLKIQCCSRIETSVLDFEAYKQIYFFVFISFYSKRWIIDKNNNNKQFYF